MHFLQSHCLAHWEGAPAIKLQALFCLRKVLGESAFFLICFNPCSHGTTHVHQSVMFSFVNRTSLLDLLGPL